MGGLCKLTTPGLILAAPFVNYAVFLGYPLASLEFIIVFGALLLIGIPIALVIWMRPPLLVPILLPLLIFLSIDLQLGIDGIVRVIGVENRSADPVFSLWLVLPVIAAFAGLSLLIRLAGDHAQLILFVILAVMIASTPLVGDRLTMPSPTVAENVPAPNRELPPIIYLILDAHAGISGLPPEFPETAAVAADLKQFYGRTGFRLYNQALSASNSTVISLPDVLAVEKPAVSDAPTSPGDLQFVLESNRLFDVLAEQGYQLRIHQSSMFDFCKLSSAAVMDCAIYHQSNLRDIRKTNLDPIQGAAVFLTTFVVRSLTYQTIFSYFFLSAMSDPRPAAVSERFRLSKVPTFGALPSLRALDEITASVSRPSRGIVQMAHLLVPHRTYLLDPDCSVIWPMTSWHLGYEPFSGTYKNLDFRRAEWAAYSDQSDCLYKKLRFLIETIDDNPDFDHAVIIIHGDHGPRTYFRKVAQVSDAVLQDWERRDNFSTLFAVRAPAIAPGVDDRELFLRDILTEIMDQVWPEQRGSAAQ